MKWLREKLAPLIAKGVEGLFKLKQQPLEPPTFESLSDAQEHPIDLGPSLHEAVEAELKTRSK